MLATPGVSLRMPETEGSIEELAGFDLLCNFMIKMSPTISNSKSSPGLCNLTIKMSIDAGRGKAKGATENVHIFMTFSE